MMVCPQCQGIKYTIKGNDTIQTYLGSNVFTAPKQDLPYLCNYCLGVGYFTGAGS